uniref:NADH dehydrogenase subunit 2 n=1 Tax=Ophioleila elegans TaxID=1815333 RepID=UPI0023F0619E|nr:NADH dehydrogenase subunit 2 [Ophioleila elegans]WED07074.1 NADH dehydrogenase subunit 2 [Ophioleila elegans]
MFIIKGFFNIFLFLAIFLLLTSNNWLLLWVWAESITLSLVVLLQPQYISPRVSESVAKYFIMQTVASVVLLFGILTRFWLLNTLSFYGTYNLFSYLFILLGLLVKLAVFPNPFWFVDVVSGLPFSQIFYVVIISKLAPLYLIYHISGGAELLFGAVGLFSVLVGSILGTNQTNIRKIVALSSISNLGWFICCVPYISGNTLLFAFVGYIFMILPLLWVGSQFSVGYLLKGKNLYYSGLSNLVLILSLLSLSGFPPLLGFFIKWFLFYGLIIIKLYWVCGVLVIGSLLSLYFYLNVCYNVISISWPINNNDFLFFCLRISSPLLVLYIVVGITISVALIIVVVGPILGY